MGQMNQPVVRANYRRQTRRSGDAIFQYISFKFTLGAGSGLYYTAAHHFFGSDGWDGGGEQPMMQYLSAGTADYSHLMLKWYPNPSTNAPYLGLHVYCISSGMVVLQGFILSEHTIAKNHAWKTASENHYVNFIIEPPIISV